MSSFLRFVSCLSLLLAGLLVAGAPPAAADTAFDDGFIELGVYPLQLIPNQATGQVWVRGANRVEVADINQGTVRGIDVAAIRDLAVNADGSKAYVSADSRILEVDAATLATRTFDLGTGHCPGTLAAGAVMVHFSDFCGPDGGALDPRTGSQVDLPYDGTPIDVPGRDRVLYWSGKQLTVVDGAGSNSLAQRELPYLSTRAPQVSSDGTRVLAYSPFDDPIHVRDLDTLGPVGSVPFGAPGSSSSTLDLTGDLVLVSHGGTSVYELNTGASVNHFRVDSPEGWQMSTMTALGSLVVSGGQSWSGRRALLLQSDPRVMAPDLAVDTVFATDAFTPAPVTGSLMDQGVPMAGETITLSNYDGTPLATATTDAEGRFSTEARFSGNSALVARWSGDTTHPSAVTYDEVWVPPTDTLLTLSAPQEVSPSDSVPISVHLKSAAGSDVDGMTVDLYRRCDGVGGWATVASVVTDSDGTATYSDSAAPCLEVEYLARHESTQQTHTSAVVTSVMVTWQSSALELTTPDDVRVGDTSTVRARLLIDGQPAADRPVTLRAGDAAPQSLVTDSDGQVAAEIPFTASGSCRVRWEFAGDDRVLPTWADTDVWVGRRQTTLSAEPSATSLTVTDSLTISGTLTDERGDPVPNAEVRLRHGGPEVLTHTASDGSYTVQVQTGSWSPEYGITVEYDGDRAHEATRELTIIEVQPLASSLSLTAKAARAAPGDEVTLSGTLTTERHEDLSGEILNVKRVDPGGTVTQLPATRLDAGGNFSFTDTPQNPGTVRYVVSHYGDNWYRTLEAETTVEVVPRIPAQLSLETDRNRYSAGDTATLSVAASAGDEILLTAEQSDGTVSTVYRGPMPANGLTRRVVVRYTTTFVAKVFKTVEHEAGTVRMTRQVNLGTTTTVPSSWGRMDGSWLVSPTVQPRIVTAVTPRRADVCLRYTVQRRIEGAWRTRATSGCRSTDDRGRATYKMSSKPPGSRWRVRPVFAGDKLNAATSGDWVELQIRRPS